MQLAGDHGWTTTKMMMIIPILVKINLCRTHARRMEQRGYLRIFLYLPKQHYLFLFCSIATAAAVVILIQIHESTLEWPNGNERTGNNNGSQSPSVRTMARQDESLMFVRSVVFIDHGARSRAIHADFDE